MVKTFNKILIAVLVLSLPLPVFAASQSVDENVTINGYFTMTGGALSMTATSGFLNLSGLSASLINTGANSLSLTGSPLNLNISGTGATSIGNGATVTLTLGSDQIGDIYYRNSSNNLARLAIGSAGQVLVASGTPNWKTLATVATGTTAYSTLNWNTSTASWQENATFLANAGALSGVASLDLITVSSSTLSFPNAGTLSTAIGNLTLQPASGTVSLDSASNLTGNTALTISTASNPLMINSSRWTINSSGTLTLATADGIYTIGEAFPNKISSTDNGIGLYNAATSTAMKSGLFTEVDGTLLSYGINVTQIGDRNNTYAGGIFRFDTRSGDPYFSVKRQVATGTEFSDIQISTSGDVGMGGWVSDTNLFPGNVSILANASSTVGFVVQAAASQTADLTQWQSYDGDAKGSAGPVLLEINSNGTVTTPAGTALNITSGGTGTINIGTDANAKTINFGTGAATETINIGGTGANVINLGNTQTGGSINLGSALTTGTITIGGTGAQTGTIAIGTGTGAQTLNLGTGGTGAKTINIGTGAATNTVNIGNLTGSTTVNINSTGTGSIDFAGHILTSGTAPTLGTCAGGAVAAGSTDFAGQVTGLTGTTCAVNFSKTWTNAPFCVVSNNSDTASRIEVSTTATVLTITEQANVPRVSWICVGH